VIIKRPSEETMTRLAIAMLLVSSPAFAETNIPATNLPETVIPKSGKVQTPETTPTKAN
jgi:hypothetical protein